MLNARTIEDTTRRKSNGAKVPPPIEAKVAVLKPSKTLTEHKEWVIGMELTRDGKSLISGDDGGHVIVWDAATATVRKRWQLAKGWVYARRAVAGREAGVRDRAAARSCSTAAGTRR